MVAMVFASSGLVNANTNMNSSLDVPQSKFDEYDEYASIAGYLFYLDYEEEHEEFVWRIEN